MSVGRAIVVLATLLMFACTYVPPGMVPEPRPTGAQPSPSRFAGESVAVAPVTGQENSLWKVLNGDVMVQSSQFREALIRSLRQSALFASVSSDAPARYALEAVIERQQKFSDGVVLDVRYRLTDTRTGRVAWSDDVRSSSALEAGVGTVLAFEASMSGAAFRAAGNNIETMLAKLAASGDAS